MSQSGPDFRSSIAMARRGPSQIGFDMSLHRLGKTAAVCLSIGVSGVALAQKAPSGQACTSSAWTGTVTYSRTQSMSDDKTTDRISGRGKDERRFEMNYNYKGIAAVTPDPENDGSSRAVASVNHTMTSTETATAIERNSCDQGKTWQEMRGEFVSHSETSGQGRDDANVTVGMNDDGTYSVGVGMPSIKGKTSGYRARPTAASARRRKARRSIRRRRTSASTAARSRATAAIAWTPRVPTRSRAPTHRRSSASPSPSPGDLEKCGAPLRVTDITFEHMKFPTWDNWQEITEQTGTVDGNWVRVKATVFNASAERKSGEVVFKGTYKGDKWDGARPDEPLKKRLDFITVSLEPGEAKDVEILWDTSGYAWFDDGRPRLVQRVKAEIWEKSKLADDHTENLKIAPKPLVLVHGPWTDWKTFETWQNILTTTHSYDWKAYTVGEKPAQGAIVYYPETKQSIDTIAEGANALKNNIRLAQESRNAWHVDVVGHSAGGLVARYYINGMMPQWYPDGRPQIMHLLMLGTPNLGTRCAAEQIVTREALSKPAGVLYQLKPEAMTLFNQHVVNRNGVQFSALGGTSDLEACLYFGKSDGIVPLPSAHWTVADKAETSSEHEALTGTKDFSEFVRKRVAIGPSGNFVPAVPGT